MAEASFAAAAFLRLHVEKIGHDALRRLVVTCWEQLNRPAVSARVITTIRKQLTKQFRAHTGTSPAVIARILADEGADLRHPEIIESDAAWREAMLDEATKEFAQIQLAPEQLTDLLAAEELIRRLEAMRQKLEREQNKDGLAQLKSLAIQARQAAASIAGNANDAQLHRTQTEIAEWLKVWLQTPNLFRDWLELRQRSEEFRANFPNYPA